MEQRGGVEERDQVDERPPRRGRVQLLEQALGGDAGVEAGQQARRAAGQRQTGQAPARWRCRRARGAPAATTDRARCRPAPRPRRASTSPGGSPRPSDQPPPGPARSGRAGSSVASVRLKWSSDGDARRTCRGCPGEAAGRATPPRTPRPTSRSRPATPAPATASDPPRPVGSTCSIRCISSAHACSCVGIGRTRRGHQERAEHGRDADGCRRRTGRATVARSRRGRGGRAGRRRPAGRTAVPRGRPSAAAPPT